MKSFLLQDKKRIFSAFILITIAVVGFSFWNTKKAPVVDKEILGETTLDTERTLIVTPTVITPTPSIGVDPTPVVSPTKMPTPTVVDTPVPTPTLTQKLTNDPVVNVGSCLRPYSDDSPWNQRITSENYHSLSKQMVSSLAGVFGSNPNTYTYPVYEVNSKISSKKMRIRRNYSNVVSPGQLNRGKDITIEIPIPDIAKQSSGNDAQLIIVNKETGDEWGFYEAFKKDDGSWESTNGYHYNIRWNGITPAGFGSRGAGVTYLAGLIRRCEIEEGEINHAIAFAYDYACNASTCSNKGLPFFVLPATKSDGIGTSEFDMPEGARLRLNPNASEEQIKSWCDSDKRINSSTCRVVVKTLQDYGMILIDNSGHPKIYAEDNLTANWGSLLNDKIPSKIPYSEFRVMNF